jgi:hypothetical protein
MEVIDFTENPENFNWLRNKKIRTEPNEREEETPNGESDEMSEMPRNPNS